MSVLNTFDSKWMHLSHRQMFQAYWGIWPHQDTRTLSVQLGFISRCVCNPVGWMNTTLKKSYSVNRCFDDDDDVWWRLKICQFSIAFHLIDHLVPCGGGRVQTTPIRILMFHDENDNWSKTFALPFFWRGQVGRIHATKLHLIFFVLTNCCINVWPLNISFKKRPNVNYFHICNYVYFYFTIYIYRGVQKSKTASFLN